MSYMSYMSKFNVEPHSYKIAFSKMCGHRPQNGKLYAYSY